LVRAPGMQLSGLKLGCSTLSEKRKDHTFEERKGPGPEGRMIVGVSGGGWTGATETS